MLFALSGPMAVFGLRLFKDTRALFERFRDTLPGISSARPTPPIASRQLNAVVAITPTRQFRVFMSNSLRDGVAGEALVWNGKRCERNAATDESTTTPGKK
ncbi:MAG: hypothetical protein U0744_11430 [Gemmataceae bacterium]